ncbi:hypothetical protein EVAR_4446_1 [Eumeta japonica]|uniref:Uncharacterized protein n=1 Tax=Eumeta variegata TaxID=151549 RepID=A0A4C1SXT9_EUMVA|nr:hypothetical protein EVAR_4446_1 [Eumeta japonica]
MHNQGRTSMVPGCGELKLRNRLDGYAVSWNSITTSPDVTGQHAKMFPRNLLYRRLRKSFRHSSVNFNKPFDLGCQIVKLIYDRHCLAYG